MDINHDGGSHDHYWQVKSPWEWEGMSMGMYGGERLPVAEWAGPEEGYIGKEFFRSGGGSMDQVTAISVSEAVMASNLGEVMNDSQMEKSFSSNNNKTQLNPVEEKIIPVKTEGNGIKGWLVEGQPTGGNGNGFMGPSEYGTCRNIYGSFNGGSGVHNNIKVIKDVQGDSLTCLKLGKRQYYEDNLNLGKPVPVSFSVTSSMYKKPRALASSNTQPPRCQVEGCNAGLTNVKEYHRRHKVCEMHSKAPKVIVLGMEQRFCQQCSRFHLISEFDEAKRSCRRRLAGHNERRRKSSSDALSNSTSQEEKRLIGILGEPRYALGRYSMPYMSSSCGGRALSLLSSPQQHVWLNSSYSSSIPGDLSSRSSAALRELIAENRAQGLTRYSDDNQYQRGNRISRMLQPLSIQDQQQQTLPEGAVGNGKFMPGLRSLENPAKVSFDGDDELKKNGGVIGNNVVVRPTLDLMQNSDSLFALQSGRNRSSSSSSSEDCEIWKSFEGTHIS